MVRQSRRPCEAPRLLLLGLPLGLGLAFGLVLGGAPGSAAAAREFSVQDYGNRVLASDPAVKNLQGDLDQAGFSIQAQISERPASLTGKLQSGYDPEDSSHSLEGKSALEVPFDRIGSKVTGLIEGNRESDNSRRVLGRALYEQSVLKNALGRDYKAQRRVLSYDDSIRKLEVHEKIETYLEQQIIRYLDFLSVHHRRAAIARRYADARRMNRTTLQKYRRGIVGKIDTIRSSQQVLEREIEVERLAFQYKKVLKVIFAAIGHVPAIGKLPLPEIRRLRQVVPNDRSVSKKEPSAVRPRRLLEILNLKEKQAQERIATVRRSDDAELSFFGGAQSLYADASGAEDTKTELLVGLNFRMLLGDDPGQQAKIAKELFAVRDVAAERKEIALNLQIRDTEVHHSLLESLHAFGLYERKLLNLRRIAEEEQYRHETGRVELENLIAAQDEVTRAEIDLVDRRIEIMRGLIRLASIRDRLFDGVTVRVPW